MVEIPSGRTLDADFMFTKLVVADIEASVGFYASVFGLVEMHRLEAKMMERPVTEVVYLPTYAGGPMFVLAQFHDAPVPARSELILGFSSTDLEALLERAVKAGGRVVEAIQESYPGLRHAFVADIEGHIIQISQVTN